MRAFSLVLTALSILTFPAQAQTVLSEQSAFTSWLDSFAQEAIQVGVSPATLQHVLPQLTLDEQVLELDQKQPERTITFAAYATRTLSPARIAKGRRMMAQYERELEAASARYGVPASLIVALWAVESSFGENMGDYEVINSLATLAYEGRRASFFKQELIEALKVMDEEGRSFENLKGSWAGAMGQSQFMPSTYRKYAADGDGDGRRDIWDNESDVFASIANYIVAEGWKSGQSWGREVRLSKPVSEAEIGLEVRHSLAEWAQKGLRTAGGRPLPIKPWEASLIQPDGPGGRSFLVYDNFRALMRWNRSTYFATSVGLLADQLASGS